MKQVHEYKILQKSKTDATGIDDALDSLALTAKQ